MKMKNSDCRYAVIIIILLVLQARTIIASGNNKQSNHTFYIRPIDSFYCPPQVPNEHCMDFPTFLSLQQSLITQRNYLMFIPGEHLLDKDFTVMDKEYVSISSVYDVLSWEKAVKIICIREGHTVYFANVTSVQINSLEFHNCGSSNGVTWASVKLVLIDHVEITNSSWYNSTCSAAFVLYSEVTLSNCQFITTKCTLCNGGGIYSEASTISFTGSNLIMGNAIQGDGGGLYFADSDIKVVGGNVSILMNRAGGKGGGMYITDSTFFSANHSIVLLQQNECLFKPPNEYSDDQGCGGGIFLLSSVALCSGRMEFKNNAAFYHDGGGVYVTGISSRFILNGQVLFQNNSALGDRGNGGGLFLKSGEVQLGNASFNFNLARRGGGAIYISFQRTKFTVFASVVFSNNEAKSGGAVAISWGSDVSFLGSTWFESNVATDSGGGIAVSGMIKATLPSETFRLIMLSKTIFTRNMARSGGAMEISGLGEIIFKSETSFMSNSALGDFGGAMAILGHTVVLFKNTTYFTGNHGHSYGALLVTLTSYVQFDASAFFHNNTADQNGGALGVSHQSHCHFKADALFTWNRAGYMGGSLQVTESSNVSFLSLLQMFNNNAVWAGGTIGIGSSSTLYVNGMLMLRENYAGSYGGAIALDHSELHVYGGSALENNMASYGGALHAIASKLYFKGQHLFTNNTGQFGGSWSLADSSLIDCLPTEHNRSMLQFSSNFAQRFGGAIWVEDVPFYSCVSDINNPVRLCFFHKGGYDPLKFDFFCKYFFANNTAILSGSNVFGGSVDNCKYGEFEDFITGRSGSVFNRMFIDVNESTLSSPVSSDPMRICLCHESQPDCSVVTHSIEAFSGGQFSLPLVAVGQRNGTVPAVVVMASDFPNNHTLRSVDSKCSTLYYTISTLKSLMQLKIYPESVCHDLENVLTVTVAIMPCPPGFQLHSVNKACECTDIVILLGIYCDINSQTFRHNHGVWIDYGHYITSQSNNILIFHPHCPFDYCIEKEVNFTLNSTSDQCRYDRQGVLCGGCKKGYSLTLGGSECQQCSHTYLLLFLPLAVAGVALVLFLLSLNMTVSMGTLNGLILFANVIGTNQSSFLPPESATLLRVFIAWLNLDLGISTCLYDGMDMYAKVWLQFLFPFYVWTLIGIIIAVSHRSTLFTKCLGHDPVSVLATLILLSYTKLTRTILTIFSFTYIQVSNGTRFDVWLYDGNVPYLSGKHIPLFLFALTVMLFLFLPYTLILLFAPCLLPYSRQRFLYWLNNHKLQPFLRSYYAPFKDKYRSWVGLLLALRFILLLIFVSNSLGNPSINLLAISTSVIFLAFWRMMIGTIYTEWWIDALELFFIVHLGFFSLFTEYTMRTDGNRKAVSDTFTGLAFVAFTVVTLLHSGRRFVLSRLWRLKLKPKLQKIFKSTTRDDTEISVDKEGTGQELQQALRPVPVTFIELREPLLESS